MAETTAADHNILCELKLSARPDQFELLRHVLGIIERQQQQIERQAADIERKDRMLKIACDDKKETLCTNCGAKEYCDDVGAGIDCNIVFYGWLEKEAQGVE